MTANVDVPGFTPLVSDETLLRQLGLFLRDACEVQQAEWMAMERGGFEVDYEPGMGLRVRDDNSDLLLTVSDEWLDTPGLEATR